jgi:hypothetical protein
MIDPSSLLSSGFGLQSRRRESATIDHLCQLRAEVGEAERRLLLAARSCSISDSCCLIADGPRGALMEI